ncbi:WD repeat-containing protein 64-like isoform X2 [Rhinatrema bivittatum]|uniref:WD repeat-containing protein 64-like isoform X2 n=1 Tax=Rhinatrema bivittatum TaxID=194408 RepID=UPI001126472D|nr:WD repeat-containing protein 64-like isoform X2 [Rhinatrema bivittatum]
MPLFRKVRANSAAGKLETFNVVSLLHDKRGPATKAEPSVLRAQTTLGGYRLQALSPFCYSEEAEEDPAPPEWLEKELIKRRQRRHSIGLVDNIEEKERIQSRADPAKSLKKERIEEQVTLEQLRKLKSAFQEFEKDGEKSVDVEKFQWIVKKCTGLRGINNEEIEKLFMKIDYAASGKIQWDEFCTYMQLEYAELEDFSARLKEVAFVLPAVVREISHGDPILRVLSTPESTLEKSNRESKWVTDFTIMTDYNKLILGTGDREIQLYELSSLEPYCQISGLESMVLKIDYCSTAPDECLILYGDDQGCVNILILASVGESLRTWKKLPKYGNMPNISIDNAVLYPNVTYVRWKVHEDWVTQLKYYDSIGAVISASNHEPTALVIGCTVGTTNVEQEMRDIKDCGREPKARRGQLTPGPPQRRPEGNQTIFQVYKGVKTFAFCKKNSLLVTGGVDRIIRMWNPYVPGKPTGLLRGHTAPVFHLDISADEQKIFSVSTDNTIKVWDIQDHSCLSTIYPKSSGIRGELTACQFVPGIRALCVTTDSVALLQLRLRTRLLPHLEMSHKEPILCCKYNKVFRQVVSCSEGSVVKVWDFETGKQVSEFSDAHGDAGITCLSFDLSGRRLVSGGRDGCLKIWNYNNGHCLHTLRRENNRSEVCDCTYAEVNKNKYIIAVGWDRRINIYVDSEDDFHHFQKPQPHWPDDLSRGHKEDILSVAQCPPSFLATSSYDGEIIVWNIVSGHVYCRLNTPKWVTGKFADNSVSKVAFLKSRALKFESAASLISNGPNGSINFWRLFNGGQLRATFRPSRVESQISSIVVSADDTLLYVADHAGYVYVYDVQDYAFLGPEQGPPKTMNYWRAHINIVTSLELVEEDNVLLSSSTDCTVRLWSMIGEFIGTFGQREPWEIFTPASWKHPMVPFEILIDPESMPVHPVLEGDSSLLQIINADQKDTSEEKSSTKVEMNCSPRVPEIIVTDSDIKEEIRKQRYARVLGRRWQHERYKNLNKPPNHGGPSTFHKLKYFEIVNDRITCQKPDMSAFGIDPFMENYYKNKNAIAPKQK